MTRAFVILALYSIVCVITVDAQEPEVPPWTGAAASTAITAEEILRRWADAVGGDKLRAIRNVYTRGDYDGTYGHGVDEEWNTRLGQRLQLNVVGSGHGALRIPFEEEDGHIFLQVRINNSGPLWFGLDTAATRSIIDKHWAASLGLQSEGSQQVEGAGGYEEGSIIKNISIELLGVELKHQTVWALPLDGLAPANGREIAGIIGYELFSHFVVDIDFITRQINLYEPKTYEYRGAGQSIPLMVQQDGAIYVQAKVAAPNHDPIDGQFVIDTGGNNTLMLARTFVEQHRLLESADKPFPHEEEESLAKYSSALAASRVCNWATS